MLYSSIITVCKCDVAFRCRHEEMAAQFNNDDDGILLCAPQSESVCAALAPAKRAYRDALRELDRDVLLDALTIAYVGRDDIDGDISDIPDLRRHLSTRLLDKEAIIKVLTEKSCLGRYLIDGLGVLQAHGIDIHAASLIEAVRAQAQGNISEGDRR